MFHDLFRCGEITINAVEAPRVPLIIEEATPWFKTLLGRGILLMQGTTLRAELSGWRVAAARRCNSWACASLALKAAREGKGGDQLAQSTHALREWFSKLHQTHSGSLNLSRVPGSVRGDRAPDLVAGRAKLDQPDHA